jgi:hypothetical protein
MEVKPFIRQILTVALVVGSCPVGGSGCKRATSEYGSVGPVPSETPRHVHDSGSDGRADAPERDGDGFTIYRANLEDRDSGIDPECATPVVREIVPASEQPSVADVIEMPWRSHSMGPVSAELALTYWATAPSKLRRTIFSDAERATFWSSFLELQKAPLVRGAVNTRAVIRFRTSHGEHWIAFDQECRLVQVESHACFAMSKTLMRKLVASLPADARTQILATPGQCAGHLTPP